MKNAVIAHPSPDLYGSDLQVLESIRAMVAQGWRVTLAMPSDGPLAPLAAAAGAQVRIAAFPVVRRSLLRPRHFVAFVIAAIRATWAARRWLVETQTDLLYVNTLTIPTWLFAGRLAGTRVLAHVHEAEEDAPVLVRAALTWPLLCAHRVVANSRAAAVALARPIGMLSARTTVLYNGVPGPATEPTKPTHRAGDPLRLLLVGRLSPRKGTDVALDAVGRLVADGRDVSVRLAGSAYVGYEWFEDQLRARSDEADLAGRVTLLGYTADRWGELENADVVLVPSRAEPFGNTAVEALLAARPLVASATQGLLEIVQEGRTGLLVPVDDAGALADAIARLADDPALASRLAQDGRADATARFSTQRYGLDLCDELDHLVTRR